MADKTKIEWTEATWNPVTGCTKVSQGCKHCYAERDWARLSANKQTRYFGRAFTDVQCHADVLDLPLRWKRPRRIFVNSMSDLFHPDVPNEFLPDVFAVMAAARQHTFQILTKRPERMRDVLSDHVFVDAVATAARQIHGVEQDDENWWPLPNVWLGVSVEDQPTADERIPALLETPAAVRWISAEPLLGPVNLNIGACTGCVSSNCNLYGPPDNPPCTKSIDWCVVGGESGPKARPMHPSWVRSLRDQCAAADVPMMFKQWGEWAPRSECYHTLTCGQAAADLDPSATRWPCIRLTARGNSGRDLANACGGDDCYMQKVGKKLAGRLLDGVQHDGYPEARHA